MFTDEEKTLLEISKSKSCFDQSFLNQIGNVNDGKLQVEIFKANYNLIWHLSHITVELFDAFFSKETFARINVDTILYIFSNLFLVDGLKISFDKSLQKKYIINFFRIFPHSGLVFKRNRHIYQNYFEEYCKARFDISNTYDYLPTPTSAGVKLTSIDEKSFNSIRYDIIKKIAVKADIEELKLLINNFPKLLVFNSFYYNEIKKIAEYFENKDFKESFLNNNIEFFKNSKNLKILTNNIMTNNGFQIFTEEELSNYTKLIAERNKLWLKY